MKFSRLFFDDPPKFDDVKLNSRKEHLHRGLLLFLHEWESARCDFLFTLFYYDEESEATPSFTRPISPQKFVRNTKRNAKNLWSAKMKPLRKFRVMRYTFIVQNSNLTILHVVCKTFWAVLYHLSLKISKFLSSLGFSACNVLLFACSNKKINWVLRVI